MARRRYWIGLQGLKPLIFTFLNVAAEQAAEKVVYSVIPRGGFARGICFFLRFAGKQIPRFTRDDKINYFFRSH